jgi:hypothetical protein
MKKLCWLCNTEKEVNEANFHRLTKSKSGFDYYCKECQNKRGMERYYSEKGPEIRKKNLERVHRYLYGITREERHKIFEAQGRKCAACKSEFPGNKHGWVLDHDHETSKVRGVLCHSCNVALGSVKDFTSRLEALITYLKAHQPLVLKAVA